MRIESPIDFLSLSCHMYKQAVLLHEPVHDTIGVVKACSCHYASQFNQHHRTQAVLVGYITKYPFASTKEHRKNEQPTQEDNANSRPKETPSQLFEHADRDLLSHQSIWRKVIPTPTLRRLRPHHKRCSHPMSMSGKSSTSKPNRSASPGVSAWKSRFSRVHTT